MELFVGAVCQYVKGQASFAKKHMREGWNKSKGRLRRSIPATWAQAFVYVTFSYAKLNENSNEMNFFFILIL